jgi:nucleotide-binding universal stress UspA family protein
MTFEDDDAAAIGEWAGTHKPVVVAVDGSERNRSAVTWGALEAASAGCQLQLVTALPGRDGRGQVLDMLADTLQQVLPVVRDEQVSVDAVPGSPVDVLLDRSQDARLIVVGKRGLGGFARVIVGSTSIALAGRSPVPVAIVPDGWKQEDHGADPVVLGIDPHRPDHRAFHLAFRRAERLGVRLVAVHGWEPPSAYSWDASAVAGISSTWEQEAVTRFEQLLEVWQARFLDVEVTSVHRRTHPASAVLEAAERAQLVVLGRHAEGMFGGFAFGSVARAVLHYVETPVIVVPGDWSPADVAFQARSVAGMLQLNAGFNCNAPKLLVLAGGWTHKAAFLEALRRVFAPLPERPAYYPGARDRWRAFVDT